MALSAQLRAAIAQRIETVAAERAKEAERVNAQSAEPVNAQPKKARSGSKHPPGYMTAYMRKRRAKKCASSAK